MGADEIESLVAATEALLKSLSFSDNGVLGRGGNGGVMKGDLVRIELYRINRKLGRKGIL